MSLKPTRMDAHTVWNVWRRIMREPPLHEALFAGCTQDLETRFDLTPAESQAARAYGGMAERARWFVVNYRFRMTNSFINALETGAPLTLRVLLAQGHDLKALGGRFLDTMDWKDYGPYVYAYCRDALDFLLADEIGARPRGFSDLMRLEREAVSMLRAAAATADTPAGLCRRTCYAAVYRSKTRLSSWLRDKCLLGRTDVEAGDEYFLVYWPDAESAHKFAVIPERAAQIYQAMGRPLALADLPRALAECGYARTTTEDDSLLRFLLQKRAIRLS